MILSKFAYVSTNNRNYKKFIELGYKFNIGDKILVNVSDMSPNSRVEVLVKCDMCGKEKNLKYAFYLKNIKKHNIYGCCNKCSIIKYKKTNLEKFGCEYPMQNGDIKDKLKEYFVTEYGVKHPSMLEEFELKKQKTNLERYGVEHQMFLVENRDKIKKAKLEEYGDENYNNPEKNKQTKLEKYGDENYNNYDKSKLTKTERYGDENYNNHDKYVETCLEKYGVENFFQLDECKENMKIRNLEKYGVEYYQSTEEYRVKYIETCLEKYGVESPMQTLEIHDKQQKSGFKIKYYNGLSYRGSYELDFIKYCEINNIIISKVDKVIYKFDNKTHYYFPDFYIEKYNLICEIKSEYYYKLDESKNISKKEYSIKSGYNFLFIVNRNYNELEKIIKTNGR